LILRFNFVIYEVFATKIETIVTRVMRQFSKPWESKLWFQRK